jgi:iron-sulfur cluster repair protein YtfE (RIC family)
METPVRQVTRRLHEEHVATLALCSRLEATLAAGKTDPVLMRAAAAALAGEIERHFAFEESDLFPRLRAAGEGEMADLLHEEHVTIRAAAQQFIALVKSNPLDPGLKPVGLELAERLASHAQKEEMSLLPALDQLLDEGADHELACAYAAL